MQLHAQQNDPPVHTEKEAAWVLDTVWTFWKRRKFPTLPGIEPLILCRYIINTYINNVSTFIQFHNVKVDMESQCAAQWQESECKVSVPQSGRHLSAKSVRRTVAGILVQSQCAA